LLFGIGLIYDYRAIIRKLKKSLASLKIAEEIGDKRSIANSYNN
jgi:hypothetical protein